MEHRDDIEQALLEGLPEDERRLTLDSIDKETAVKLARLRAQGGPTSDLEPSPVEADPIAPTSP